MITFLDTFLSAFKEGNISWILPLAAFSGGIIAGISPCSVGILPIIIGYIGGFEKNSKTIKTFIQLFSFVLGLSTVLSVIGVLCALTGRVFISVGGQYWILFIGSLVMVLGLNLLGCIEIPIPNFIKKMPKTNSTSLFIYPFVLGTLFALAATPCSTPILAAIMSFASLSRKIMYSILLLFLFSIGQGLIIILAGVFTSFVKKIRAFSKYSEIIMKLCGVLLILSSLYLFCKVFSPFFE
ncbi:MAG: cytochrome c biogenesis protein CcdA [Candidatus Gastranaerophilales bacterium]|nr:cytochrome c biogenesis protein CcdA [Candidatus Gastranaerophilales bacterium]